MSSCAFRAAHNAGHTLVVGNVEYKLSLLPSGVVRPGKLSIIGNGVVVDPWALIDEIDVMRAKGLTISPETLRLADNAALILPSHGALERAREERRGEKKLGTTGRGIGPAYEDKVGRRAVRVCDLADPQALEDRVDDLLLHHNALLRGLDAPEFDRGELLARLREIAPRVLPYAAPVWRLLDEARRAGRRILFEGAQGAMLDVDHGTYPYVTSSNTVAGQAAAGSGIAPGGDRLCPRHHQGLHDAGRHRPVSDRADRRGRPDPRRARPRVRRRDRTARGAAAGLTRSRCGRRSRPAASTASR